jgi:hypothetical protein
MRTVSKSLFKQYGLVIQFQQALPAKAVVVFFGDEFPGSNGKLYPMTLAVANISRLAFK